MANWLMEGMDNCVQVHRGEELEISDIEIWIQAARSF